MSETKFNALELKELRDFLLQEDTEKTSHVSETIKIDTHAILFPDFIPDEITEEICRAPTEEENEETSQLYSEFYHDGDKITDKKQLERLRSLSLFQRFKVMAKVARNTYIGPNEFSIYFQSFPEDADYLISLITQSSDEITSYGLTDYEIYQLGAKAFEAACQVHPPYWEEAQKLLTTRNVPARLDKINKYLEISSRSRDARSVMLGDYKTTFPEIFEKYSLEFAKKFDLYIDRIEKILSFREWGYVEPEKIFNSSEFTSLSDEQKINLLIDIITYCHNTIIFHAEYNSVFSDKDKEERYSFGGRGLHSIIYQTDHSSLSFSRSSYNAFSTNYTVYASGEPVDESAYELTIEESIRQLAKLKDSKVVDFLLHFWDVNLDPAYGPEISNAISQINPQRGAEILLTRIPEASDRDKRRYLSLLFRLELGSYGISSEGVKYLGRRFDLGENNNPDYFIHRITSNGTIGVFGGDKLRGIFQVKPEDFNEETPEVIKKISKKLPLICFFMQNLMKQNKSG